MSEVCGRLKFPWKLKLILFFIFLLCIFLSVCLPTYLPTFLLLLPAIFLSKLLMLFKKRKRPKCEASVNIYLIRLILGKKIKIKTLVFYSFCSNCSRNTIRTCIVHLIKSSCSIQVWENWFEKDCMFKKKGNGKSFFPAKFSKLSLD